MSSVLYSSFGVSIMLHKIFSVMVPPKMAAVPFCRICLRDDDDDDDENGKGVFQAIAVDIIMSMIILRKSE